ncbi:MAG: TetR/AcrR family transcriptional regulator [Chloroflexota bacterium]|nr:TetR/AcrR family transcriptional regulator [Chloroflexota bacterium]
MTTAAKERSEDLREACVREALAIIESDGIENLSLREVARRLGVSHQAPYKHFPSRDHILAEVVRRAFESFAAYLDTHTHAADMRAMGQAYLHYAAAHPLQYRLMFGTPLPDPAQHPAMMASARHAFDLLLVAVTHKVPADHAMTPDNVMQDALFIWATLHGLASILQADALHTLALPPAVLEDMIAHTLLRIGRALQ